MTTTEGPDVSQPKIPADVSRVLQQRGLSASCYQPVSMFIKNGRKLPHVAEPDDPWQVILRRESVFGVEAIGTGTTLREAIADALARTPRHGLSEALKLLAEAVGDLCATISHAG